jgi:large subunit ribosomal protein L18
MSVKKVDRKAIVRNRHRRIRKVLSGTSERPRLAVYRSSKHIYAQLINDLLGHTLTSASSMELRDAKHIVPQTGTEAAVHVGKQIAERAKAMGIEAVVFDRGGNLYHGRVKALADAAREVGLVF